MKVYMVNLHVDFNDGQMYDSISFHDIRFLKLFATRESALNYIWTSDWSEFTATHPRYIEELEVNDARYAFDTDEIESGVRAWMEDDETYSLLTCEEVEVEE